MSAAKKWYLRTAEGVFGPETEAQLVEWAERGAVLPGQAVSRNKVDWKRVEDVPFLDMRFGIDMGDGQVHGPLNRIAVEKLLASGNFSQGAKMIEVRPPFGTEKEAVREARAEAPVEKIVEKVVEKVVVDETRVKELEALLKEAGTREAGLGEELKTSKARIEELEGREKDAQARGAGLGEELKTSKARIEELEVREKDAQAREAGLGEELKTSKARIEELEGREKEAQARIKKIQAEKIDATTRLTSALKIFTDRESSFNIRLMAAKSSADAQTKQIAELEKAMEESRAREEVLRGELDSLRDERDAAKAATVAETERATGIQAKLDATRGELEVTKGERDSLRGELDAAKAATVAETERATGIQAELDAVRGELEAAKGEHDSLRGELEGVNVKMAELEASLKEAGARETTLREEFDAAKARRLEVKPSASGGIKVGDVRRLETALAGELSAAKKKGSGFAYEFFAFMQSKHRKASPLKGKEQQEPLNDKEQQT